MDSARHVIKRISNPKLLLIYTASYDAASTICQSLRAGGSFQRSSAGGSFQPALSGFFRAATPMTPQSSPGGGGLSPLSWSTHTSQASHSRRGGIFIKWWYRGLMIEANRYLII